MWTGPTGYTGTIGMTYPPNPAPRKFDPRERLGRIKDCTVLSMKAGTVLEVRKQTIRQDLETLSAGKPIGRTYRPSAVTERNDRPVKTGRWGKVLFWVSTGISLVTGIGAIAQWAWM